ncbi:hypothetical protein WJX73_004492 [Symbiochloris irregularis]|uniref:Uncharacterized protein n=1 Tax=Symbiochloris irregularis TaxID=706552 RepID=A0AAW1PVT8_9CHLO
MLRGPLGLNVRWLTADKLGHLLIAATQTSAAEAANMAARSALTLAILILSLCHTPEAHRQLLQVPPFPIINIPPFAPVVGAPSPPPPIAGAPSPPPSPIYGAPNSPPPVGSSPPPSSPPPPLSSPPLSSPPPPPPGKCFYGNSDVPLFCDYPPPPNSPPPPPNSPVLSSPPPPSPPFVASPPPPPGTSYTPIFTTGPGNYQVGSTSYPASIANNELPVETADDFYVPSAVTIQGMSFEGLLPADFSPATVTQYITSVGALLYALYPQDSNPSLDGTKVATRLGSPADYNLDNITTTAYQVTSLGDQIVSIPAAIDSVNIQPPPNQLQAGSTAPPAILGKKYQFFVPFQYSLPAGAHVFVAPQIGLDCSTIPALPQSLCNFVWSSAQYPTSANGGTPFPAGVQDEQSWARGPAITPDWASIGTQILGTQPYNAAFTVYA